MILLATFALLYLARRRAEARAIQDNPQGWHIWPYLISPSSHSLRILARLVPASALNPPTRLYPISTKRNHGQMASPSSPLSPTYASPHQTSSPSIPQTLWNLRVPLFITHKDQPTSPFVTSVPRFSYLAQLLPRLSSFFGIPCSSFHHEEVQLRNLAAGLLVDLYQPQLPWRLEVGAGAEWDIGDTFLNGVKEVSRGSQGSKSIAAVGGFSPRDRAKSSCWRRRRG